MLINGREGEALSYAPNMIIPNVVCPDCGKHMRLATVEPELSKKCYWMSFDCKCGFEHRLLERAR